MKKQLSGAPQNKKESWHHEIQIGKEFVNKIMDICHRITDDDFAWGGAKPTAGLHPWGFSGCVEHLNGLA